MRARLALAAIVALAVTLVACAPDAAPSGSPTGTASPTVSPTPTPTPTIDPIAQLSLAQRVGQLFMVGTGLTGADPVTLAAITDRHAGSIFLHGRSAAGTAATAALVQRFTALVSAETTGGVPLWVATDQEGGDVQVLTGPGFDPIPSALRQGGLPTPDLQTDAARWGAQLTAAGVNMNLAPVADIVTSAAAAHANPPIGALDREYGFDEATVARQAGAFASGMRAAGIQPTFKHFPGLGRVAANTDFHANVVDTVIGPDSPDVDVYRTLLMGGPAVVMTSTAIYQRIDPSAPASFSPKVVTGLLRGTLGYRGVVITDDLSAAAAVRAWPPAQRAVLAIDAGVDVVLVASDPQAFAPMYDAVLAKAQADPVFAAKVTDAARRVVVAKASLGG